MKWTSPLYPESGIRKIKMIGSWVSWSGAQEVKEINFDVCLVELLRIGLVHYWWVCCGSWQVQTPTSQGPRRGSSHEQTYERDQMLAVNRWARGAVVSKWILTRAKRVLHPFIPPKSSPSSLLAKQILARMFLRQASHVMQELREMARWLCKDVRWWPRATPMR